MDRGYERLRLQSLMSQVSADPTTDDDWPISVRSNVKFEQPADTDSDTETEHEVSAAAAAAGAVSSEAGNVYDEEQKKRKTHRKKRFKFR